MFPGGKCRCTSRAHSNQRCPLSLRLRGRGACRQPSPPATSTSVARATPPSRHSTIDQLGQIPTKHLRKTPFVLMTAMSSLRHRATDTLRRIEALSFAPHFWRTTLCSFCECNSPNRCGYGTPTVRPRTSISRGTVVFSGEPANLSLI